MVHNFTIFSSCTMEVNGTIYSFPDVTPTIWQILCSCTHPERWSGETMSNMAHVAYPHYLIEPLFMQLRSVQGRDASPYAGRHPGTLGTLQFFPATQRNSVPVMSMTSLMPLPPKTTATSLLTPPFTRNRPFSPTPPPRNEMTPRVANYSARELWAEWDPCVGG